MFTSSSKYFFILSAVAWVAALLYGLSTGGDLVGVLSAGYKGGVGDHLGYIILQTLFLGSAMLGVVTVMSGGGDAQREPSAVEVSVSEHSPGLESQSNWGPILGFGVASIILGVSISPAFLILGVGVVVMVGFEWTVLAWSDRSTADPSVNAVIRERLITPMEVPLIGSVVIAFLVLAISRVLLAVSELGAVVVSVGAAAAVFGAAVTIAKSQAPRRVISAIVTIGAVAVLAGGIIGAVLGERDFEHHSGASEIPSNE